MNVKEQPISEYYATDKPKAGMNSKYPSQLGHLSPKSQKVHNYKNRELIFSQISKILNS